MLINSNSSEVPKVVEGVVCTHGIAALMEMENWEKIAKQIYESMHAVLQLNIVNQSRLAIPIISVCMLSVHQGLVIKVSH